MGWVIGVLSSVLLFGCLRVCGFFWENRWVVGCLLCERCGMVIVMWGRDVVVVYDAALVGMFEFVVFDFVVDFLVELVG